MISSVYNDNFAGKMLRTPGLKNPVKIAIHALDINTLKCYTVVNVKTTYIVCVIIT